MDEKQDEKADFHKKYLSSWLRGYQKSIIKCGQVHPKTIIDNASYNAVFNWTNHMLAMGFINEIKGKDFDTFSECVDHHINNLSNAGILIEPKPTVEPITSINNLDINGATINIPACDLKSSCSSDIAEYDFQTEDFPCQRVACFAAAVRMYLKEEALEGLDRENITYFMKSILKQNGCVGVIHIKNKMSSFLLKQLNKIEMENENGE